MKISNIREWIGNKFFHFYRNEKLTTIGRANGDLAFGSVLVLIAWLCFFDLDFHGNLANLYTYLFLVVLISIMNLRYIFMMYASRKLKSVYTDEYSMTIKQAVEAYVNNAIKKQNNDVV